MADICRPGRPVTEKHGIDAVTAQIFGDRADTVVERPPADKIRIDIASYARADKTQYQSKTNPMH